MKTVTLRSAVPYRNGVLKAGTSLEVSNEQAQEWQDKGVLHDGKGPTEQDLLADQQRATDLFIGLQHGDPSAIAEIQALLGRRGITPAAAGLQPGNELAGLDADYAEGAPNPLAPPEPVFASEAEEAAEDERAQRLAGPPRVASRKR